MQLTGPGSPRLTLSLTALTGIACLMLLIYIQSSVRNTTQLYTPWVDAAMEIKLETSLAHLWLEELMAGDNSVTVNQIRTHLQKAHWYTNAMLDGGQNEQGTFLPLTDTTLRQQTNRLLYQLMQFQKALEVRLNSPTEAAPGSTHDQALDSLFLQFAADTDQLEHELKQHIQQETTAHNTLMLLLLLSVCGLALITAYTLLRFTRSRNRYLLQLADANKRISEQNTILQEMAHTDQLTGLPNRKMLEMIAQRTLSLVQRQQTFMSISFIDLDFFKPINDQYGHHIGDKVLINLARIMSQQLREGDTLARWAGDEFILLLQATSEKALKESVSQVFERINLALQQPILSEPEPLHIRLSAGTALAPQNGNSFDNLLHNADLAMYISKNSGRGSHIFFQPEPTAASQQALTTEEAATE